MEEKSGDPAEIIDIEDHEDDIFSINRNEENVLKRAWKSFKAALMGTLFVIDNDTEMSFTMNLIGMASDFLQLLALPFNTGSQFPWNPAFAGWFMTVCYYSKLEFYISQDDQLQNMIIYGLSICMVFLNLAIAAIVGYKFTKREVQNKFLLKILRTVTSLFTTVLFMPLVGQFTLIISCAIGRQNFEGCPQEPKWLLISSSVVISILFSALSLVVTGSFYEQDCKSEDPSARPHARVELISTLLKGAISVQFSFFEDPEYHASQIFSILALGVILTFLYIWYLPNYHYLTTTLQAQFYGVYTWAGLCLLLTKVQGNPEDAGPVMLFYTGSPCIWLLTRAACDWRRDMLLNKTIDTVRNPYEVELHSRFLILHKYGSYKFKDDALLNEVEEFYFQAERKFPRSSMLKILVAQFYLSFKNRNEAIPKLDQASKLHPMLDEQFIIYKTRQTVGKDAITLVTFTSYLDSAQRAEILALTAQTEFWQELRDNKEPNFERLIKLAKNITKNIDQAETHYKSLMNIDPTNPKMLPMYVYFLEDVMHRDDDEVANLRNRLRDIKNVDDMRRQIYYSQDTNSELPTVVISGDKGTFGLIEKINNALLVFLQLPKTKIMNSDVAKLMPIHYGDYFKNLLRDLRVNFDESQPNPPIETFFIDRDGYLVRASCEIRIKSFKSEKRKTEFLMPGFQENITIPDSAEPSPRVSFSPEPAQSILQELSKAYRQPIGIRRRNGFRKSLAPLESLSSSGFECKLHTIIDDTPIITIESNGNILNFNKYAAKMLKITPNNTLNRNIKDYISNFDNLMERAHKNVRMHEDGRIILNPVQTYISSYHDSFIRLRINTVCMDINGYSLRILYMTELPEYSKETQKFFKMFAKFLEVFVVSAHKNSFKEMGSIGFEDIMDNEMHSEDKSEAPSVKRLMRDVHQQIDEKNKKFSPELTSLNRIFILLAGSLMILFGVSFAISGLNYATHMEKLEYLSKFNEVQNYSIILATYIKLLDATRQGLKQPYETSYYYTQVSGYLNSTKSLINQIYEGDKISEMDDKIVKVYIYDKVQGYTTTLITPVDSVLTQVSGCVRLIEEPLSSFDIANDPSAFWVYENGQEPINHALEYIAELLDEDAENAKLVMHDLQIDFAICELVCLLLIIILVMPYLLKSEKVHIEVVGVFYSMPVSMVEFLYRSTMNQLKMRQDPHYPDCKFKYSAEWEIWDEYVVQKQKQQGQNYISRRQSLISSSKTFLHKICGVFRTGLMKRIYILCIIAIIFIVLLQLYIGQIMSESELEYSTTLVRAAGTLGVLLSQAHLSTINTLVMHPPDAFNSTIYSPETLEGAFNKTLNYTSHIHKYLTAFRVGEDKLHIEYDSIYKMQIEEFYNDFFEKGCFGSVASDCTTFMGGILNQGYYNPIEAYMMDLRYLVYNSKDLYGEKDNEYRWNAQYDVMTLMMRLHLENLLPMSLEMQDIVLKYFEDIVVRYEFIRQLVLIFFCITIAFYYIFVIRRGINRQERKKRLTRNMLLLLPQKVVGNSSDLQSALADLNYD